MPYVVNPTLPTKDPSLKNSTATMNQLSYDFYSNLPPPPYTTSSSSKSVNNAAPAAADDHRSVINSEGISPSGGSHQSKSSASTDALATLQHVKDYFTRLKDQSLTTIGLNTHESNSATTDTSTDSDGKSLITINNFIMPSFHSQQKPEPNSGIMDSSINEGLERIGASLQQLIAEAQASLTKKPLQQHQRPQPQPLLHKQHSISESSQDAGYPCHYNQNRFHQSQEKISVAIEQLEQSIQNMSFTSTGEVFKNESETSSIVTTVEHHNKIPGSPTPTIATSAKKSESSVRKPLLYTKQPDDGGKGSAKRLIRYLRFRMLGLLIAGVTALSIGLYYYATRRQARHVSTKYDTAIQLALFTLSLNFKKNTKMASPIDKFLVRSLIYQRYKTSTSLLKWIHRINMCINTFTIINAL